MASNGEIESEDNEITESNGDKVVTMMDVLQEQEDFEEDANAVLGASDDKNCTYPLGYIKRQAIYACMTCCSDAKEDPSKRAGVCLACSLTCHENHELIELYTKRNFRCDCGNPKFNSHPCQFTPEKIDLNEENSYNQNFSGLYCVCHRPYPDPEATEEDEMIQCIICEDWLHASHLEATVPSAQYAEMICKECMQKNEFLHDYSDLAVNTENDFIDIITTIDDKIGLCNGVSKNEIMDTTISEVDQNNIDAEMPQVNESKNESDLVQNSKEIANQNEKEEDNDKTHMESEVPMDTEQLNDENLSTVTKDPEMAQDEVSADKIVSLSESDSVKIQEEITETAENKEHNEENIESHINALKEIVEASEESVADIIISEIDNAKVVENVENNDKIQHMEAEVPMDTNTEKPNDENMSPDAKDSEKAQGEITASPETEDSASVSNPVNLQENIIDNVETKESNEENIDIKINALKDIVEDSEESVADNITSEIDKPQEDENKDYNINKTQHNIESEVPMDTNTDKVIMPTHAKDSEVAQGEVIESAEMDKSVSVSNPEKSHNITDTAKNKDSYEDSIDSLKEIVESSEDNVSDNIISEKEQSKNKDSIDTLKELVKSSEDNVANNITSEQEQSKEEEIKETTVSPIGVIANTNEPKVDEVLPSTNDISEAENKNEKSLLSDDSNKLENNEHINDPKTEKRNEKQLADDGKNMLTEDNINQNSDSVVDNDTHPSNDANGKTVEPSAENNQNIETQNDKTGIHTASISEDNIIKKTDVSNSAEELEKMEEDRLLADPDENAQKEEATENKNSVESINKESTGKSSEPLKKDNIIEEPKSSESGPSDKILNAEDIKKSSISEPKDQDNENPDKTDILDENNTETVVQSEDMKTKKDIDGSCTENSINSTTIHNETKMEVNIEETQYSSDKVPMEGTSDKHDTKRKLSVEESADSEAKKRKVDSIQCVRPKEGKRKYKGATFWPSHFRQKLCTCNECLTMYKDLSILFLMDLEDTVAAYENLGKEKTNGKPASQYEKGLQALSSLDRIQQINVLTEYNNMRDKFLDFLKSFKDRRKIVTEEDVKAFFAGMKPKRRPDGVYFCR